MIGLILKRMISLSNLKKTIIPQLFFIFATNLSALLIAQPLHADNLSSEKTTQCIQELRKKADRGDGDAAKKLGNYFGNERAPHFNPELAFRYLRTAIQKKIDVSTLPFTGDEAIVAECRTAAPHKPVMSKPIPLTPLKSPQIKTTPLVNSSTLTNPERAFKQPEQQINPLPPEATPQKKPRLATSRSGQEYELMAKAEEAQGKSSIAIHYLELARNAGSTYAAQRLYDIYAQGANDVDADYIKSIEAARAAQKLGLQVAPNLPRK